MTTCTKPGCDHSLTPEQREVLLRPIKEHRVGKDGKGFSHVEAYELRAHLIRVFGFARWSEEVVSQELVFETSEEKTNKQGKSYTAWSVTYRTIVRLTVCASCGMPLAVYTEGACGDASNQPSRADAHDLALKTSESQAFKRCCVNLGDQFGLSLYRKGSLSPVVGQLVGHNAPGEDVQDAAPTTFREADSEPTPAPEDESQEAHEETVERVAAAMETAIPAGSGFDLEAAPQADKDKARDGYRADLLAATTKREVLQHMRALEMDRLGEAEVGDENGAPITLRDLANRRLKEVR